MDDPCDLLRREGFRGSGAILFGNALDENGPKSTGIGRKGQRIARFDLGGMDERARLERARRRCVLSLQEIAPENE